MQIKDIMSRPIVTAPVKSTLDSVARLMWEYDCGIVPIVADDGRLAGVITDRDICMAAYTQGQLLAAIPVESAMAREVVACHSGDTIESAEVLMRDSQIRRLPVLDHQNHPIGIVSMNDIARFAARQKKSGVDRELVRTLASICEPRGIAGDVEPDNIATPA
jgi:CBS domain-containing protein